MNNSAWGFGENHCYIVIKLLTKQQNEERVGKSIFKYVSYTEETVAINRSKTTH